jgi:methylmalonyl-CoA mutase cobalamin-binding subunit
MSKVILIGTVGSDVHSVANTLLEKALVDSGLKVQNLGVAVPEDEWMEITQSLNPDLVLIGSMNGDLLPLHSIIRKLTQIFSPQKIVIGGKLNLGSEGMSNAPMIKAMGVSVLENDEVSFQEIVRHCKVLLERIENLDSQRIQDAR